jgi:hypothetical protein
VDGVLTEVLRAVSLDKNPLIHRSKIGIPDLDVMRWLPLKILIPFSIIALLFDILAHPLTSIYLLNHIFILFLFSYGSLPCHLSKIDLLLLLLNLNKTVRACDHVFLQFIDLFLQLPCACA